MSEYSQRVGNVELVSLTDGQGGGVPTDIFPASGIRVWREEYPELLDKDGLIHPRYGSVALRSGGKLIVVDTGNGPPSGTLMEELRRKGVDRDAVDLVVITHLHGDHVGWNMTAGRPTFPRARYLVSKADWDHWTGLQSQATARIREQVVPLEGLEVLDLIDGAYRITDELTMLPTPGHTPGHISIVISSAGERGFVLGDVAHSPAQAHHTDWSPTFDVDPALASRTRHEVFDRLEADGSMISAGHLQEPGFGRLARREGRRYWRVA